jgi:arthrofactin-type cyclic lipopeptide synthetase C
VGAAAYSTALYDAETVDRHMAYLRHVLEEMVAGERRPVEGLAMLPKAERKRLVEKWNATDAEYPRDSTVHELFEARAESTPDAVAVVFGGERLTYGELNRRANRLAHHLRERGVEANARVALVLPRSVELVIAELATLKAGAAYVPVDPSHPAERIAFMVADSGSPVVLSRAGETVPSLAVDRIDIDALPEGDESNPGLSLGSETLAYVMYTSGSTGEPKGVMVPHRAITRLVLNNGYADFNASDAVAFAANPAFDATTMEVWGPLLNGGRIVVISQDVLLDPARFGRALREQEVSVLWLTVGLFNQYAEELREELGALRHLIVGGDALDPRVIAGVLATNPPKNLTNGYGPTETTTFAVTHRIERVEEGARSIPLGRPVSNTRVYLLDARGEPVPVGVAGEMYIGGDGVARGYLNRPELTAERFVADPFSAEPARMYRTGDLGRWLADGTIEFLGRTDHQVKVRGYRIELGEIEARLAEHAGIRDVVVLAREDVPGDKRLVAYCVGDDTLDAQTLRAHLAEQLPEYMVPAAYVWLERFPLTSNGKVDRRALPAPEAQARTERGYEPPATETEIALAGIWAEVLGVERVGRWDDFFELGGHSLRAVQIVARVRQLLGTDVSLGELFVRPVLADFALVLEQAIRVELPPIEPAGRDGSLALSFAQQRLWFLEKLNDLGSTYHVPSRLRMHGELDREAMGRALDRIVARHETLRTTFAVVGSEPEQRIAPAAESRFHLVDHDLSGDADAAAELGRIMAEESRTTFDLERGPLLRGRLVRMAADDHVLLLTMHHIVTDGWSMGIFVQELTALYGAFRNGEPDPLPELAVQYADYAAWQRRATEGDVLQEQAEYWTRTLAGAPELIELPTDRPRPVKQEHGGASIALELDEELTAGLNALSRRHGTTLFMTLLAGWAAVLGRLSGQDEVVIGTPTANRGRAEVEGLIGFFINTLALRLDLSGTPTVAELLGRVKARALAAQQHQDIPFEQVVERVAPARSPAHTPLFQVMFTWQNAPRGALELPGLTLGSVEGQSQETAKLDLALTMWEAGGRIAGAVTYATSLYDAETVERYLGYLRGMLGEMVAGERRPVERLAILPAAERERVVVEWNAAEVEYPADACIHELFERQAELTPDGVAVFFDGRQLGYGELNRRANRLAHYLMELGVGADSRVVICVDRGLEMVVGMLAALKAGAAYVPLDPAYPVERLHYMFEDAAPSAMLTQASLAGLFRVSSVPVIDLGASQSMRGRHSEANPGREATGVTPEHLAYVIYTSGSTGEPKGVAVEHRQLASYTRAVIGRLGLEGGMRHALVSTMAADLGNTVLYPALCTGGTLHVVAPETATSAERFTAYMARHEIDVLKIVPSHLAALLFGTEGTDGLPRRRLVLGGEASSRAWVRELRERAPEMAIANHYGPTETTVGVLVHPDAGADEGTGTVPLGRPLPGTRVYVLDRGGEPVPTGAAGELCVGGAQVARGYLRRPALTAERFVPDPFSAEPGARMYRTGDLARWLANGTVEFLGRTDFQVKVRGFRIEPGEIESRLAEHSGVREAIVVAREDTPGDRRLVAYCVGDVALESQEMRAHLSERLPEHMVPAAYVWLDRLPLTPNGKVDRKALPAPDGTAYVTRGYEPPVGETEEILAEIWMDMLEVERVGRQDNFFELGGHSLLAVQIISQIKSILGADVEMQEIFTYTTIESLALRVQGTEQAVETDGAIAVRRTGSEPALFIVHDGSGSVGYAQVLHRHIRAEVPVYSLPDTPASEPRLRTIEGMAARLARMVREVQPNGPYRLAGWSFGGIIAYQVAVQLIGENQEVEFLGLMDTKYGGVDGVADVVDDRSMLLHVIHTVDGLAAATLAKLTELVTGDTTSDLETLVRKCQAVAHLPTAVSAAEIQQLQNRLLVYRQAQHEYDPQPIGIPIDLFTAMESTDPDPLRGWEALLPTESIRITPVPGTHFTMMETPDVESLGRAMSSAISPTGSGRSVAEPESPLVRLRFGKTGGAPLFCVPGAGGSVTSFADLASAIDAEWPVHGLQPRGVDGENVAHSTVEAAAEFYLGAVEAMQPTGPVHLLGHSFGGWVAFEMAQRLRRSGRAVGSLTLLDTEVPTEEGSAAVEHDSGEALLALVEVFELTLGRSIDIGAGEIELLDHAARLGLLHERLVRFGVVPRNSGHDVVRGPFRAFASSLRATYRPSDIYLEPLRLVLVSDPRHDEGENQAAFAKIVRGWKQRAPNVMFTVGRGNHFTALKPPHVASLASLLAADR